MTGDLKRCCANLYESDLARMLLGESFHPGGLDLTRRLGRMLGLRPGLRVLNVASGKGESAIFLAREFACEVIGIDFGPENVKEATRRAAGASVVLATFLEGDAERLNFPDGSFDAVICECAFCTFPDKPEAAREFARVLRPGGRVGLSDLMRAGALPAELTDLIAWIACIADARPTSEYASYLESAGFTITAVEPHNESLAQMARDVQGRLLGLELMAGLNRLDFDLTQAKRFAGSAMKAIQDGVLGYSLITGALA